MPQPRLEHVKVPREIFILARERTHLLIGELQHFFRRSTYIERGDALGDALANAYIQGMTDVINNCDVRRKDG